MSVAELGDTQDPRALIPGDPAEVQKTADTLRGYGTVLVEAGDGLRRIDDGGWTGKAAEAFHDFFEGHPQEWIRTGEGFTEAAVALDVYRHILEWAQRQAGEAIHLWNEAQAATEQARGRYDQEAADRERNGAPPPGPFVDPGAEKRAQAESMLKSARQQLHNAGEEARAKLAAAKEDLVEGRSWLGQLWHNVSDAGEGLADHIREFGETAWKLDPARLWAEPEKVVEDIKGLPALVQQAWANGSPDDLIDLHKLRDAPARTIGENLLRIGKIAGPWGAITAPYEIAHQVREMAKEKPRHHVIISHDRYPEAAEHAEEAQDGKTWAGYDVREGPPHPSEVTIDREGAKTNRQEAIKVVPAQPRELGIDRDEYPPAVFEEGGKGSSVKYIDAGDNRGAGSSMKNQMRGLDDGTKVTINVR